LSIHGSIGMAMAFRVREGGADSLSIPK
jgi:hypothetical protein